MIDVPSDLSVRSESVFRHRPFTMFLLSGAFSTLAFQMQAVAVGWQVYRLTGSALALGMVGLAEFIPALLLAFVVGHIVDRFNRRMIMQLCQAVRGIAILALAIGTFCGALSVWWMYLAIFVIGSATAFYAPSRQAILPSLVPKHQLSRALSWSSTLGQASVICGPALGGLLYAFSPSSVYAVSAMLIAISFLSIYLVQEARVVLRRDPVTLASVFAGLSFIRSRPELLGAISLDLFAVLLGGATALLPIFAHDILRVGPWGLGILRSAPAAGAIGMSFVLAYLPLNRRVGKIMFSAVAVFGISTIVFALSHSLWLSVTSLVILGAADSISMIIRGSLVQLQTPDEMRGRVNAIYFIFVGTSNELGEFESGVTASWFGAVRASVIGGIGTLAVLLIWMRVFPALLEHDRLDGPR